MRRLSCTAAVKGAVLLGKYAEKVYVIYRGSKFTRPKAINLRQLETSPNIVSVFDTTVVELLGDDGLSSIRLNRPHHGSESIAVHGLFIEIGADPRVELANELGVELDEINQIIVDKHGVTNVKDVFSAGDLTNGSGEFKQTITASVQVAIACQVSIPIRVGARQRMRASRHGVRGLEPTSPRRAGKVTSEEDPSPRSQLALRSNSS